MTAADANAVIPADRRESRDPLEDRDSARPGSDLGTRQRGGLLLRWPAAPLNGSRLSLRSAGMTDVSFFRDTPQ